MSKNAALASISHPAVARDLDSSSGTKVVAERTNLRLLTDGDGPLSVQPAEITGDVPAPDSGDPDPPPPPTLKSP